MEGAQQRIREINKAWIVLVLMLGTLLLMVLDLWRIQVMGVADYAEQFRQQSERHVRLPAQRGRIYDRHGVCLADNRPCYSLALQLEQLRQRGKLQNTMSYCGQLMDTVALSIHQSPSITDRDVQLHFRKRLPLPLVAWRDLSEEALARFSEHEREWQGVVLQVEPVRYYPRKTLAAHLLGYVGRSMDVGVESSRRYDYVLPELQGKRGLESKFNTWLAGEPGEEIVTIDASGYKQSAAIVHPVRSGEDVMLTLDSRIQEAAEMALADNTGAVVVLDVNTGDILAMASAPSFDPNGFSPLITTGEWSRLLQDAGRPLINRAIHEIYAPGSVFKPMVAIAALENGSATEYTEFDCPGYFALGSVRFRCWNSIGHGRIALRKAIEQSCNSYFCALGLQCGYDGILRQAAGMGFGQKTGMDCDMEVAGILPNENWKRRVLHDGWRAGDTCNISIGQGALAVTPIQVAVMTAAIANGGKVFAPRVVLGRREGRRRWAIRPAPIPVRTMNWSPVTCKVVRGGMNDVIQAPAGTGSRARLDDVVMAGKTGTAEFGPKSAGRKHTWMILFAPFDRPQYAVVMVLDSGESGGKSVAPRMRVLMDSVFHGIPEGQG